MKGAQETTSCSKDGRKTPQGTIKKAAIALRTSVSTSPQRQVFGVDKQTWQKNPGNSTHVGHQKGVRFTVLSEKKVDDPTALERRRGKATKACKPVESI